MSSGRRKHCNELKLKVVRLCLEKQKSMRAIAKEYRVDYSDVRKWRDAYLEHGVDGLCARHGTYSCDFKCSVVEYMETTGASVRSTAAHFNIPSIQTVTKWSRIYREQGKDALYRENRGRRA